MLGDKGQFGIVKIPGRTETGNKKKEKHFSFMNLNATSFSSACVAGGIVLAQVREAAILAAFPPRARERHLLPILPTASQLLFQKFSQANDLV